MSNEAKTLDLFASSGEYSASEEAIFRSAANGIRAQATTIDGLAEALKPFADFALLFGDDITAHEQITFYDADGDRDLFLSDFKQAREARAAAIGGGLE